MSPTRPTDRPTDPGFSRADTTECNIFITFDPLIFPLFFFQKVDQSDPHLSGFYNTPPVRGVGQ